MNTQLTTTQDDSNGTDNNNNGMFRSKSSGQDHWMMMRIAEERSRPTEESSPGYQPVNFNERFQQMVDNEGEQRMIIMSPTASPIEQDSEILVKKD